MKKFLAIAAIAIAFTACNDEKKTDTVKTSDTSTVVTPAVDTTHKADTATVVKDTVVKTTTTVDTIKKTK